MAAAVQASHEQQPTDLSIGLSSQSAPFLLSFGVTMSTRSPLFPVQFLVLMAPSTQSSAAGSSFCVGDDGRQELHLVFFADWLEKLLDSFDASFSLLVIATISVSNK